MPSRLQDWQLPLSQDEAGEGKFSGLKAPDSVAPAMHPIDIHAGRPRWQATGSPGSTPVVLMASTKEFRTFSSAILAERLAIMAIALFVIQRIPVLASSLPVRLLDTVWQLRFISACLDSATITLLALGLIHLAIASPRAGNSTGGGRLVLPLPGLPAPSEEACSSRLLPEDDNSSETGVPPPPLSPCLSASWMAPSRQVQGLSALEQVAADGLQICRNA